MTMKIEAAYPLSFKARPARATKDKDILVSTKDVYDIPEISLAEMPVVFESRSAFAVERGFARKEKKDKWVHQARMMGGSLYRPVSKAFGDHSARLLFGKAFPQHVTNTSDPAYNADISLHSDATEQQKASISPMSRPLYEQFLWRLSCEQVDKRRLSDMWPSADQIHRHLPTLPRDETNRLSARNLISFEDIRRDLHSIDETQLSYCHAAFKKHMERFVIADGQLWQRSRAMVYKVQIDRATYTVTVSMTHAPDWHDTRLNVRYFDLSDRDEAFECAHQTVRELHAIYTSEGRYRELATDLTVPYEVDAGCPSFNSGEDELLRLSCAVAAEARRFLVRNPSHVERLGAERVAAVWRAFEEVRKTDYIFEEFGDPIDDLQTNFDIWLFLGRHQSTYSFDESAFSNLAIRRARVLEENRQISLSPILSAHPHPAR
jgi:hypothetical protein